MPHFHIEIIPQYKENDVIAGRLLNSINSQANVDFNDIFITIINDKSDVLLSDKLFSKYPNLNINYLINDNNTGPGIARRFGIERTEHDYIMFMDCDDVLYDKNTLYIVTSCIEDTKPDLLITNIIKEVNINNEIKYVLKRKEETYPWLHGKVFKRELLDKNNICFHNNLRHLEDSYFWTCVIGVIDYKKIIYLDFPSYVWKLNNNSITRKKNDYEYIVTCFNDYYNCPFYAYDYLCKHNSNIKDLYLIRAIFDIYLILNSNYYEFEELKDEKNNYLLRLKDDIKKNINIYDNYKKEELEDIFNKEIIKEKNKNNNMVINKSFNDFYNMYLN